MIELQNVGVQAGRFSLHQISLNIKHRDYGVLMGQTGCGKTTLLEAICGLRPVIAGRILLGERDVTGLAAAERGIGYVPQDGALFSTLSVREHLAYALRIRGWTADIIQRRTVELETMLGIAELSDRYPIGLSGGEARRVALGRALAFHPQILILDEPLTGLDEATRDKMYELLKSVQSKTGVTVLHVTHSREDVRYLADRCFVLEDGRIRENGAIR
jgi:ABC-type sugar transport system ATPase subunit